VPTPQQISKRLDYKLINAWELSKHIPSLHTAGNMMQLKSLPGDISMKSQEKISANEGNNR
jgi:hypothetical protein